MQTTLFSDLAGGRCPRNSLLVSALPNMWLSDNVNNYVDVFWRLLCQLQLVLLDSDRLIANLSENLHRLFRFLS